MKNVSVTRVATLWQVWDGEILYPHPMTCELRERLDVPPVQRLYFSFGMSGEVSWWNGEGRQGKRQIARCHDFGGVTEDCILAPNGIWYHVGSTHLKFIEGAWYATWTGYRNDNLAHMLNAGFWAYSAFMPVRWLVKNIYRRTRYAIIERLVKFDLALQRRGWRSH